MENINFKENAGQLMKDMFIKDLKKKLKIAKKNNDKKRIKELKLSIKNIKNNSNKDMKDKTEKFINFLMLSANS